MPKVKVFESKHYYDGWGDGEEILKGITDWEEVSEKEYELLKTRSPYIVLRQVEPQEYKSTIHSIISEINKREAAAKKSQEAYEAARKEREAKALQKKLDKAKKLLEQHGNSNNS